MPSCFQLFRQGSANAQRLADVDNAICAYLDVPASDEYFVGEWYDFIGFSLACGKSFTEVGATLQRMSAKGSNPEWVLTLLRINHFLMENYSSEAWWEPKANAGLQSSSDEGGEDAVE
jgi:hypothetical protein